ncbi:DUF4973 domain-containing protein [Parabacteroides pacaensis]|uniref:DUF4973 domain-containing protein n=1 Tax=Parabacteroides pacaensis TaxID=2086575 RepID=UPI000D10380D|nr:DUF4973 domain-containing protein [Parabacteroides pacaensis]
MKHRSIYNCLIAIAALLTWNSCNNEWEDEQYEQLVSLKAPTNDNTPVTQIRLKYKGDTVTHYNLPVIVSGTTVNSKDLDVHIGIDLDTLNIYNKEHFYERKDLYFRQLTSSFYEIPDSVVRIPAGKSTALLDIQFKFKGLDLSDKWVLPLIVKDSPSYNYQSHPRKDYNNALLWITPFNDYSGDYGTTNLSIYTDKSNKPIVVSNRTAYVVDENSVFFYAGATKETREDRRFFKITAAFQAQTDSTGTVSLQTENPDLHLNVIGQPTYYITKMMDNARPTLLRRTVTINLEYEFEDPLETPGYIIKYRAKGTMSLQRNINTVIPDEEFAIEW